MIVIDLPTPPSVNGMFYNRKPGTGLRKRGRGLTPEYLAWRRNAGWDIQIAKPGRAKGPVSIAIALSENTRGDADNRIKACLDLLVAHGVIEADSKKIVRQVSIGYEAGLDGARVTVTPYAA